MDESAKQDKAREVGAAAPVWSKSPVATGTKLEWMPTAPESYVLDAQVLNVSGEIIGWKLLIAEVEKIPTNSVGNL